MWLALVTNMLIFIALLAGRKVYMWRRVLRFHTDAASAAAAATAGTAAASADSQSGNASTTSSSSSSSDKSRKPHVVINFD
jgi:hypothetical protein